MNKKVLLKRSISILLALSLITTAFAGCAKKDTATTETSETKTTPAVTYTAKAKTVKKTETVYVNMDSFGSVKKTIVSDWIHTDTPEVVVDDATNLKNIANVKSDVAPVETGGGNIQWNMGTTDLYYKGESSDQLPVSISIKYYLNDVEVNPSDIAGQSGKIKIVVNMINNISTTRKIDGKSVKIYNPMVVIGGTMLPEDEYQNVSVSNGKIIGDGSKEIIMLVGMPGINESVGFNEMNMEGLEDLEFNENFTITADVTNFEIGNLYFAAMPFSSLAEEMELPNSVSDLTSTLNDLKMLESSIQSMDPNNVITTLMQNPDKVTELISTLNDAVNLYKENKILIDTFSKYLTSDNLTAIQSLITKLDSPESKAFVKLMQTDDFKNFIKILPGISSDMETVGPLLSQLSTDLDNPEVQAAINNLPQTMEEISKIKSVLTENQDTINTLTNALNSDNMTVITSILDSSNASSLLSKMQKYTALTDKADVITARLNAMLEYGNNYKIFSSAANNMATSVMFVYQTPSVSKPDTSSTEETTTAEVAWYKKLFTKK